MKKKVYEKQLSQLRPDLTSEPKRNAGAKSKSKKSRSTRQGSQSDRPGAGTSGNLVTSKESNAVVGNTRLSCAQPKVGTLPKVDVLMKRRVVESDSNSSKPSSVSTPPAFVNSFPTLPGDRTSSNHETKNTEEKVKSDSLSHDSGLPGTTVSAPVLSGATTTDRIETIEKRSPAPSESQWLSPPSPRYRIDLNNSVNAGGYAAAQSEHGEQNISGGVHVNTSASITGTESGTSVTLTEGNNHRYAPILTEPIQAVSGMTVPQTFPLTVGSQPLPMTSAEAAGPRVSQPVSLISSPQMLLHPSGQHASEGRSHFTAHPGDYSMSHHQTISTSTNHNLHTLTPMVLSDSGRLDETGPISRVVNYEEMYNTHSGASWEQENNRYTDYPSSWQHHNNEGAYLNNGITYAHKRPYINGNSTNVTPASIESNNNVTLSDYNVRNKLYPHLHQQHEPMTDATKDSDIYSNGYTSDESSCAKAPLGGSSRRRRKRVQTPVQRSAANMRERRRMCHLNDAFNYLKEHLPNVKDKKKLSRIQTLKAAIYYIHLLRDSLNLQ